MPLLAVDACALLHAKQLAPGDEAGPLTILEQLADEAGARFIVSPRVRQEHVANSLASTLAEWETAGWIEVLSVSPTEKRTTKNRLCRGLRIPGDADIGLIALASREAAVLLTHDDAAAGLAGRCTVRATVDLLDLADLVCALGLSTWDDVENVFRRLKDFAWKPADWQGSVQSTVQQRPAHGRHLACLSKWAKGVDAP